MNGIRIMDCTLRDGGYAVDTKFGDFCIKNIIQGLCDTGIDIIELGYLKDCTRLEGSTTYSSISEVNQLLPQVSKNNPRYSVMVKINTLDIHRLERYNGTGVEIIRICFYKSDMDFVPDYIGKIREKGYKIFLQPMDIPGYSKDEMEKLAELTNKFMPEAFYIVDSYGSMYLSDLNDIFTFFDRHLNKNLVFGLHTHNNLQSSFGLVQVMTELSKNKRDIILDGSAYGMGRGAGNANLELITAYLNKKFGSNYNIDALLELIETTILPMAKPNFDGYNADCLISGMNRVHVNNIEFLTKNYPDLTLNQKQKILKEFKAKSNKNYDYKLLSDLAGNEL